MKIRCPKTGSRRGFFALGIVVALGSLTLVPPAQAHRQRDLAAFSWPRFTDGVYVLHPSTGGITKVYDRTPYFLDASTRVAWSPDHSKVAFEAGREYAEDLYVWNSRSGRVRRITDQAGREIHPSWSPDGGSLAYVHETYSGSDLFVVRADGSARRRLTRGPADQQTPEWSPDGSRIAYASSRGLFTIRPDGTSRIRLTRRTFDQHPAWAPGSQRLVFSRIRVGGRGAVLVVVGKDGSRQRDLTGSLGRDEEPEWAPDGSRIVFVHRTRDEENQKVFLNSTRPSGNGRRRLTPHLGSAGRAPTGIMPEWSRDSRRIAYLRYHTERDENDPETNVWVMNRNGSAHRNLTPKGGPNGFFGLDW